jgi:hypothetical protein
MEDMFRMIWLGDSSKAKYRQRSPRQAGGGGKGRRQTCFTCARCTGDQDGAAPVEPLAIQHYIQFGTPVEMRSMETG